MDFRYLLENYAAAGNVDRLYGEELPLRGASHHGDAVAEIENRLAEFRIGLMDWPRP